MTLASCLATPTNTANASQNALTVEAVIYFRTARTNEQTEDEPIPAPAVGSGAAYQDATAAPIIGEKVRLRDGSKLSIASVYLPPALLTVGPWELKQCINQLKEPRLILGDFNSHCVDWGGLETMDGRRCLSQFLTIADW